MSLNRIDAGRNQYASGSVAGVSTALARLRTNDVHTSIERLLHMLRVADHIHNGNAGLVQGVDDWLWWDADGTNEEGGFLLDNDVDELIEPAFGVVILEGT